MKTNAIRVVSLSAGLIAAIIAGTAFGDGYLLDLSDYFDLGQTCVFSARTEKDGDYILVEGTRGPLVAGTFDVVAKVTTNLSGLTSIQLKGGNDDNVVNGTIDPNEWLTLATAYPSTDGNGVTTAETSTFTLSSSTQGVRIEHNWSGSSCVSGMHYDELLNEGLE